MAGGRKPIPVIAAGVILGTPILALGITFSPLLERVAGVALSAAVVALGIVQLRTSRELDGPSRMLLVVSGAAVLLSMPLAAAYALRDVTGGALAGVRDMVRVHGWLNAVGFATCGLLGWGFVSRRRGV